MRGARERRRPSVPPLAGEAVGDGGRGTRGVAAAAARSAQRAGLLRPSRVAMWLGSQWDGAYVPWASTHAVAGVDRSPIAARTTTRSACAPTRSRARTATEGGALCVGQEDVDRAGQDEKSRSSARKVSRSPGARRGRSRPLERQALQDRGERSRPRLVPICTKAAPVVVTYYGFFSMRERSDNVVDGFVRSARSTRRR